MRFCCRREAIFIADLNLLSRFIRLRIRLLSETAFIVRSSALPLSIRLYFRCLFTCASAVCPYALLLSARGGFCRGLELTFAIYPSARSSFFHARVGFPRVVVLRDDWCGAVVLSRGRGGFLYVDLSV